MDRRVNVLEYFTPKIDAEHGVITGVKIIGVKSDNGYSYPPAVLRKAKALYENVPVFILHGKGLRPGTRKLVDHFGSLQNVRERSFANQITGLFGDLHIKMTHPLAKPVLHAAGKKETDAASRPRFGLSHDALIDMTEDGTQVTEIISVHSVDLVESPATTKNLFEEQTMPEETEKKQEQQFPMDMDAFAGSVAKRVLEAIKEDSTPAHPIPPVGAKPEAGATRKSPRLRALEDRTDDPVTEIGNTHEDFIGALRGYPRTNK